MREKFFVIFGGQNRKGNGGYGERPKRLNGESDLGVLKKSPCLECDLFTKGSACSYVDACSKIDDFQRTAATHCTLCKFQDIRSIV